MQALPEFKKITDGNYTFEAVRFQYKGATIQISRYPGPDVWGWNWQHFVAVNGDSMGLHGRPYQHYGVAVRVAKRHVDKGDFESSKLLLKTGSFSSNAPTCPKCKEKMFEIYRDEEHECKA